jgi:hypothetical protein
VLLQTTAHFFYLFHEISVSWNVTSFECAYIHMFLGLLVTFTKIQQLKPTLQSRIVHPQAV